MGCLVTLPMGYNKVTPLKVPVDLGTETAFQTSECNIGTKDVKCRHILRGPRKAVQRRWDHFIRQWLDETQRNRLTQFLSLAFREHCLRLPAPPPEWQGVTKVTVG